MRVNIFKRNGLYSGLALSLLAAFILVGCNSDDSSNDSNNGSGNGTTQPALTEEERIIGAAVSGYFQISAARSYAEGMAEKPDDPTDDSAGSASYVYSAATAEPEVDILFVCPSDTGHHSGDGAVRMQEGDLIDIDGIDFPAKFSNSPGDTMDNGDFISRSNCFVTQEDEEIYSFKGSFDIAYKAQVGGTDGRIVYAQIGGFTGTAKGDKADMEKFAKTATSTEQGDISSRIRGLIYSCEGCVSGDLSDFTGDAKRDATSISFLEMELDMPGIKADYQVGKSGLSPFVFISEDHDTYTYVTLDGLLKYHDHDSGCGFDVTYQTREALMIEGYETGQPKTVGGELRITDNESNEDYFVSYQLDGSIKVANDEGLYFIQEPSQAAQDCGFVMRAPDDGSNDGTAPDLANTTWDSACIRIGASSWGELTYAFAGDQTVEVETRVYDNDGCTENEQIHSRTADYQVGDAIDNSSQTVQAYEIDFVYGTDDTVYDLYGVDGNALYLGDVMEGPDQQQFRDDQLDMDVPYSLR